jgi:hypothetical protein
MGNNTGPIVLLGLLGLLLVLWMKKQRQSAVVASAGGGSAGPYDYGKQAVGGVVSLAGSALKMAPPAVDLAGNLLNKVSTTGAGVVNTAVSSAISIPKNLLTETGGLFKSAGNTGASAGKSIVHTLSLGALF